METQMHNAGPNLRVAFIARNVVYIASAIYAMVVRKYWIGPCILHLSVFFEKGIMKLT